jgi:2',3'-cyclic-nucleotide 2'-phosphodiesterase (5'-nucleotidase family)
LRTALASFALAASLVGCNRRPAGPAEAQSTEPSVYAIDEAPPAPIEEAKPAPVRAIDACAGASMPLPDKPVRATCEGDKTVERISLLHVGDMHGHFHSYLRGKSPFAALRGLAERRRAETGGRVLFVDAGDDLEKGSIAEIKSRGDATVHLLDRLGLDVRTLGNHDFAWGIESVLAQAASPTHEVLASNLTYTGEGNFAAKKSTVIEIGCVRIGLFGLVINGYDETDDRVDGPYLGAFVQEHDPGDADKYVALAAARVKELREEQKVDAVIAVNHLGLWKDKALVDAIPGLDLVVSSHDHVSVPGYMQGRYGVVVSSGSFLGGKSDARVGEAMLDVDTKSRSARLVSAAQTRIEELRDLDPALQAEVDRVTRCFAPDADRPLAELDAPMGNGNPESWMPTLDAAIRKRFPATSVILYEAWIYGGVVKGELPRGPVTPQDLADFAYSERQKPGTPGFTAMTPIEVTGKQLRDICAAPLREPSYAQRMHRVCPTDILDDETYTMVVERRPLHAPKLAFQTVPASWPTASSEHAVEVMDLLVDQLRKP